MSDLNQWLQRQDDLAFVIGPLFVWFFMGIIGYGLGSYKRRGGFGFLLGVLLGPIGWLLILLFPPDGKQCPFCRSIVPHEAIICRHCRSELHSARPQRKRGQEFPTDSEINPFAK